MASGKYGSLFQSIAAIRQEVKVKTENTKVKPEDIWIK